MTKFVEYEKMTPLDFFKQEIRNEHAGIRISAVNRLHLIASAMDQEDTQSKLLPLLAQVAQEEPFNSDEEFLFSLAKQYSVLMDFIPLDHMHRLIAPLEHLAAQDETVIRDQAVQSLCKIVTKAPDLCPQYLVATLHKLATKTDFFAARVSACALLPTAYKFAKPAQKPELRKAYITLCADDTPMVRRAAVNTMRDIVSACDKADLLSDIISSYTSMSQEDTQDTIRVACVHTTIVIAQMLNDEENKAHTISVITEAFTDRSWRVRLAVVQNFHKFCDAFGPELTNTYLMQPFVDLLKDNEQEVRKSAVLMIEQCLYIEHPWTNEQLTTYIVPMFRSLSIDQAHPVRAALAMILGPIAKQLGPKTTQAQLLSLISDLMKDEFHDVRLNIVSHTGLICEVLSAENLMHSLLPTIQNLIMDNHWRIRQSVVEQVPKLAKLFGVDMFESKLQGLFLSSLKDSVFSVRHSAIMQLKEISDAFGATWTAEKLLQKLIEMYSVSTGYATRVTTLNVLPQVSDVLTSEQICQYIIPMLLKATTDNVPNVRFCACDRLQWMIERYDLKAKKAEIREHLTNASERDLDIDVQYYAQRALVALDAKG